MTSQVQATSHFAFMRRDAKLSHYDVSCGKLLASTFRWTSDAAGFMITPGKGYIDLVYQDATRFVLRFSKAQLKARVGIVNTVRKFTSAIRSAYGAIDTCMVRQ